MPVILIVFLLGIIMTTLSFSSTGSDNPLNSSRIIAFKQSLGFDAAMAKENKNEYVDLDWMKLPVPPGLNGWTPSEREYILDSTDDYHSFDWTFKRGEEKLTISAHIYTYTPNKNEASKYFLLTADSSTMSDIPWIKGPSNLGTISAIKRPTAAGLPPAVMWSYRNVFAEVSPSSKAKISSSEIASWLQKQMEANLKLSHK